MVVNTAKALYFRTENSTLAFGKMEQVYKWPILKIRSIIIWTTFLKNMLVPSFHIWRNIIMTKRAAVVLLRWLKR